MRLDDVRGFVFDVDGTLVRRYPDGVRPLPGAVEVLDAIRDSGRKLAIFTNGSHLPPEEFARERFGAGISEEELLLRLTMPAEQVDAMVAARGSEPAAPLARPGRDPLVRLLGELAKRESLSYARVEKGDDLVVWRRAA